MSNKSAIEKLHGHGRVICSECGEIIITCKCLKCSDNVMYDICDQCEKKKGELNEIHGK